MEDKKTIVIIWKWNIPGKWQRLPVLASRHQVLQIDHHLSYEDILNIIDGQLRIFEGETIILLHRNSWELLRKTAFRLEVLKNSRTQWAEFGNGDDFIYYKAAYDLGLIDQSGNLAHGLLFSNKASGIKRKPNMLTEEGELQQAYFDPVWRHYFHRVKTKLYEFKVNALRYFIFQEAKTLNKDLKEQFDSICALLSKHYPDITVAEAVKNLEQHVENGNLHHKNAQLELNRRIHAVLEMIPEPIY